MRHPKRPHPKRPHRRSPSRRASQLELPLVAALFIALGAATLAQSPKVEPLTITVDGIRNTEGAITVAAFDTAPAFEAMDVTQAAAFAYLPATAQSVSVTLHDLPKGAYAVVALHDENLDGDLNMSGEVPTEGYAYAAMGPSGLAPKFADAAVAAGDGAQAVLRLKYW